MELRKITGASVLANYTVFYVILKTQVGDYIGARGLADETRL